MKNFILTILFVAGLTSTIYTAMIAGCSIEPAPHDVAGMMQLHSSRSPYELATLSLPTDVNPQF